jgi:hypothetical protein
MVLMDCLGHLLSVYLRVKIFVVQRMSSVRLLSSLDRRFTHVCMLLRTITRKQ